MARTISALFRYLPVPTRSRDRKLRPPMVRAASGAGGGGAVSHGSKITALALPAADEMHHFDGVALRTTGRRPDCGRRTMSRLSSTTTVRGSRPRWSSSPQRASGGRAPTRSPFMVDFEIRSCRRSLHGASSAMAAAAESEADHSARMAATPQAPASRTWRPRDRPSIPPIAITGRPSAARAPGRSPAAGRAGMDWESRRWRRAAGNPPPRRSRQPASPSVVHRSADPAPCEHRPCICQGEVACAELDALGADAPPPGPGRPFTNTAASGVSPATRAAGAAARASAAPPAAWSRAWSATAGPAAAIAAARIPTSAPDSTASSVIGMQPGKRPHVSRAPIPSRARAAHSAAARRLRPAGCTSATCTRPFAAGHHQRGSRPDQLSPGCPSLRDRAASNSFNSPSGPSDQAPGHGSKASTCSATATADALPVETRRRPRRPWGRTCAASSSCGAGVRARCPPAHRPPRGAPPPRVRRAVAVSAAAVSSAPMGARDRRSTGPLSSPAPSA